MGVIIYLRCIIKCRLGNINQTTAWQEGVPMDLESREAVLKEEAIRETKNGGEQTRKALSKVGRYFH